MVFLMLASAGNLYPGLLHAACDCTDLVDLKNMLDLTNIYLREYAKSAKETDEQGTIHGRTEIAYNAPMYNAQQDMMRNYTAPVRISEATNGGVWGAKTNTQTCETAVVQGGSVCLDPILLLHENVHAATCRNNTKTFLNNIGSTLFCIAANKCDYRDLMTLSDVYREEVSAYTLQRAEIEKQIETAKQDFIKRQFTPCEPAIKAQDPNYKTHLKDIFGAAFTWLF